MRHFFLICYRLTALAFFALSITMTTVSADTVSLAGRWMCLDKFSAGIRNFDVTYLPSGEFKGVISMKYRRDGKEIIAQVNYKAQWRLDGNKLFETPISAEITHFQMDGKDAMKSSRALKLLQTLLLDQTKPAKIRFVSSEKFYVFFGRIKSTCKRLNTTDMGS